MSNVAGDRRPKLSLVVVLLVIALLCVAATAFIAFRDMRDATFARRAQSAQRRVRINRASASLLRPESAEDAGPSLAVRGLR